MSRSGASSWSSERDEVEDELFTPSVMVDDGMRFNYTDEDDDLNAPELNRERANGSAAARDCCRFV